MISRTALLAVLLVGLMPAVLAAPAAPKAKAGGCCDSAGASCCLTKTRCCDNVAICCDSENAPCCLGKINCCEQKSAVKTVSVARGKTAARRATATKQAAKTAACCKKAAVTTPAAKR